MNPAIVGEIHSMNQHSIDYEQPVRQQLHQELGLEVEGEEGDFCQNLTNNNQQEVHLDLGQPTATGQPTYTGTVGPTTTPRRKSKTKRKSGTTTTTTTTSGVSPTTSTNSTTTTAHQNHYQDSSDESQLDVNDMGEASKYGSVNCRSSDFTVEDHEEEENNSNLNNSNNLELESTKDFAQIEKMRRRLRFYFMNPLEKWLEKRQFPYKLTIQLIKIILVTLQLVLFASYRYANVNYAWDNKISLSHLFLKDWESSREITSYPPPNGPLAVYKQADFYAYINYAVNSYGNIQELAIGPYFYEDHDGHMGTISFCIDRYQNGEIYGYNQSYIFNSDEETLCLNILPSDILPNQKASTIPPVSFNSSAFFASKNFTISFSSLLEARLSFNLKTVRFRDLGPLKSPDCFLFDITLVFNNHDHDGQLLVDLDVELKKLPCKGNVVRHSKWERIGRSSVNYIVIALSSLSFILCCRAVYRAQFLKAETIAFFKNRYQKELTTNERLEFINFWYLLIIFNDILLVIGSTIKEEIDNKELTGDAWNICSVCLGVGNLFVWFGVLRYLGFFKTYNVLILTLKRATPNVLRFLICALLIYAGFTFCGWLILGPYHIKFSSLSTTSECLFALINGDDMFATFAGMSSKSNFLWWFSRFYLYIFISLFIYVVLSLFIALIMDAYETIKLHYSDGFPRSLLHEFINGSNLSESHFSTGTHQNTHYISRTHSIINNRILEEVLAEDNLSRKTSAGAMLDSFVETICGAKQMKMSPNNRRQSTSASTREEEEPLIRA